MEKEAMNFTFGICVSPETPWGRLAVMLEAISKAADHLKYHEVILVGHLNDNCMHVLSHNSKWAKYLPYEGPEDKPAHITKKKNLIADIAAFDNLCIMHDYLLVPEDFSFWIPKKYSIYIAPVHTMEGDRSSDWLVNPEKMQRYLIDTPGVDDVLMDVAPFENAPKYVCALPYAEKGLMPIQYVSGGFITCKTEVIRDNPLNEDLYWGDAEDLEWSERVVPKYGLVTQGEKTVQPVKILKPLKWAVNEIPSVVIEGLKSYYGL
jgi:hypothetical protein